MPVRSGDDSPIEHRVVKISPDLTGFQRQLRADLKKATTGVTGRVQLAVDTTGFRTNLRTELAKIDTTHKVKLEANCRHLERSIAACVKNMKLQAATGANAVTISVAVNQQSARNAAKQVQKVSRELRDRVRDDEEYLDHLHEQANEMNVRRTIGRLQALARAEEAAYAEQARRDQQARDRLLAQQEQADAQAVRAAKLAQDSMTRNMERAMRERERRMAAFRTRAAGQWGPSIIDLGGRGIRPMNALLGTVVALSPALFAMGTSALHASTSVAALGAAGIGAALGLGAVTLSLGRVREAMKLRETLRKADAKAAAKAAASDPAEAFDNSDAIREGVERVQDARRAVIDANRGVIRQERDLAEAVRDAAEARNAISQAYRDAAKAVRDLREEVSDLRLQESGANADIATAREELAAVERNFWATPAERAQALQKLREAEERLSDTQRERQEKTKELQDRERKGLGQSKEVREARERSREADRRVVDQQIDLADALERVADTQRAVARAQADLARARSKRAPGVRGGGAAAAGDAAAAELARIRAQMSPAARALDDWLAANQGMFDNIRRQMESAVLPGFLDFLKQVTARGRDGVSTLDLIADMAANVGRIIGRTAGRFGELTRQPFFRRALRTINRENTKSFQLMADTALILVKPITQIIEAAAPLGTRFARAVKTAAKRFAEFIDSADKSGKLRDFFDAAGDAFSRWVDLGKAVVRFVFPIFREALPRGNNLVERLTAFINELGNWTNSAAGASALGAFFDKFRDLKYGDITQMLGQLTVTVGAFKAVRLAGRHPLVAALAMMATVDPEAAGRLLSQVADFVTRAIDYVAAHPTQAATLLAILAAAKIGKSAVDIGLKLPGIDNLKGFLSSRFKWLDTLLGGARTPVMNVQAGVVNVMGGLPGGQRGPVPAPVPGARPGPRPALPAGAAAAGGAVAGRGALAGLGPIGAVVGAAIAAYEIGTRAHTSAKANVTPAGALEAALKTPSWDTIATAYVNLNPFGTIVNTITLMVEHGFTGWLDIARTQSVSLRETILTRMKPVLDWFEQLPGRAMKFIAGVPGQLAEWAGNAVGWLVVGLVRGVPALYAQISSMTTEVLLKFATLGTDLLKWAERLPVDIALFFATLPARIEAAIESLPKTFESIWTSIARVLAVGTKTVVDLINRFTAGINEVTGPFGITPIPPIEFALAAPATQPVFRGLAYGGAVEGHSPHRRADNIPAMLTAGEYVQPVDVVQHYGTGFMERVRRKELPRGYAYGGLVTDPTVPDTGAPLLNQLGKGIVGRLISGFQHLIDQATGGLFDGWFGGGGGGGGPSTGDPQVAHIAESTARAMGATTKQLVALMEAGMVESRMRNLNYGDRDSLGFLQQRPSQGWGTPAQIMDVAYATRSFIRRAKQVDRPNQSPGELAQDVQISALPLEYDKWERDAVAWINHRAPYMPGFVPTPGGPTGGGGNRATLVAFGRWLQTKGYSVSEHPAFGGVDPVHADGSWHYRAGAIDVNAGAGTSRREQRLLAQIVPEAHRRGLRSIFMEAGHYNHAHFDIGGRKYDSGGILPPGVTVAVNNTGRNEYVTKEPPGGTTRLDRRDLMLLAQYLATAMAGQQVVMDGRRVGEIVHGYDYLPRGL